MPKLHTSLIVILTTCMLLPVCTALAASSKKCPGESGYYYTNDRNRNPRAGGFVSNSALVDDSVTIAKTAAVCGSASVLEHAKIYGNAVISGEAEVSGKARVYGNARVSGTAQITGKAKVSDHAKVNGDAIVEGIAWIRGYKEISSGHYAEGTHKAEKPGYIKRKERQEREKKKQAQKEEQRRDFAELVDIIDSDGDQTLRKNRGRIEQSVYNSSVGCIIKFRWKKYDYANDLIKQAKFSIDLSNPLKSKWNKIVSNNPSSRLPSKKYCGPYFCFESWAKADEAIDKFKDYQAKYCVY